MGFLLDFFGGGPARLQALLIGALVGLVLLTGTAGVALWYRAEAASARAERDIAVAQGTVLAAGVKTCSASVDLAHRVAGEALDAGRALLAEARKLTAGSQAQVLKLDKLLEQPTPLGAGCEQAWEEIRKARGAQ